MSLHPPKNDRTTCYYDGYDHYRYQREREKEHLKKRQQQRENYRQPSLHPPEMTPKKSPSSTHSSPKSTKSTTTTTTNSTAPKSHLSPWSRVARLQAYHADLYLQASKERKRKTNLTHITKVNEREERRQQRLQTQSLHSVDSERSHRTVRTARKGTTSTRKTSEISHSKPLKNSPRQTDQELAKKATRRVKVSHQPEGLTDGRDYAHVQRSNTQHTHYGYNTLNHTSKPANHVPTIYTQPPTISRHASPPQTSFMTRTCHHIESPKVTHIPALPSPEIDHATTHFASRNQRLTPYQKDSNELFAPPRFPDNPELDGPYLAAYLRKGVPRVDSSVTLSSLDRNEQQQSRNGSQRGSNKGSLKRFTLLPTSTVDQPIQQSPYSPTGPIPCLEDTTQHSIHPFFESHPPRPPKSNKRNTSTLATIQKVDTTSRSTSRSSRGSKGKEKRVLTDMEVDTRHDPRGLPPNPPTNASPTNPTESLFSPSRAFSPVSVKSSHSYVACATHCRDYTSRTSPPESGYYSPRPPERSQTKRSSSTEASKSRFTDAPRRPTRTTSAIHSNDFSKVQEDVDDDQHTSRSPQSFVSVKMNKSKVPFHDYDSSDSSVDARDNWSTKAVEGSPMGASPTLPKRSRTSQVPLVKLAAEHRRGPGDLSNPTSPVSDTSIRTRQRALSDPYAEEGPPLSPTHTIPADAAVHFTAHNPPHNRHSFGNESEQDIDLANFDIEPRPRLKVLAEKGKTLAEKRRELKKELKANLHDRIEKRKEAKASTIAYLSGQLRKKDTHSSIPVSKEKDRDTAVVTPTHSPNPTSTESFMSSASKKGSAKHLLREVRRSTSISSQNWFKKRQPSQETDKYEGESITSDCDIHKSPVLASALVKSPTPASGAGRKYSASHLSPSLQDPGGESQDDIDAQYPRRSRTVPDMPDLLRTPSLQLPAPLPSQFSDHVFKGLEDRENTTGVPTPPKRMILGSRSQSQGCNGMPGLHSQFSTLERHNSSDQSEDLYPRVRWSRSQSSQGSSSIARRKSKRIPNSTSGDPSTSMEDGNDYHTESKGPRPRARLSAARRRATRVASNASSKTSASTVSSEDRLLVVEDPQRIRRQSLEDLQMKLKDGRHDIHARRRYVLQEILETEQDYVHHLNNMDKHFFKNLPLVSCLLLSEIQILMRNITDVIQFQNNFLRLLEDAFLSVRMSECENSLPRIGLIFSHLANNLHVYSPTCSLHEMTEEIINNHEDSVEMAKFLKDTCEKLNEGERRLEIKAYLIKPVQRIMRYPILLEQLLKNVPEDDEDHKPLVNALEAIREALTLINANKKAWEMKRKTQQLWSRLGGPLPSWELNPQNCGVIAYGESRLKLIGTDERGILSAKHYDFYLLDQGFILAVKPRKSKKPGACQLKWWWKLVENRESLWGLVEREDDEEEFSWIMRSRDDDQVFKFVAGDEQTKRDWLTRLTQFMGPPIRYEARDTEQLPVHEDFYVEVPRDVDQRMPIMSNSAGGSQAGSVHKRSERREDDHHNGLHAMPTANTAPKAFPAAAKTVAKVEHVVNANGQVFTLGEYEEHQLATVHSGTSSLGVPSNMSRNAQSYDDLLSEDLLRQYENEKATGDGVLYKLFKKFGGGSGTNRVKQNRHVVDSQPA